MTRALRWVGIAWLTLVVAAFAAGAIAWVAGWDLLAVDSSSMAPTVPRGALAVVEPVAAASVEEGDVVSFRDPGDRSSMVLHRVMRVVRTGDGGTAVETQGDANRTPDPVLVGEGDLRGRMRMHVPRLGVVADAMRPPWGTIVLGSAPLVLLGVLEIGRRRERRRASADDADRETASEAAPDAAAELTATR